MFALSLSFEGIDLLHRGAGGWRNVGEVPLHTLDLTSELAALRKTASVLEPNGVRTKVIIPNDQIKYLTIQTEGLSDGDRTAQVRVALDGATPYDVDDLVFDVSLDGNVAHVAAVARDTLDEFQSGVFCRHSR